MELRRAIDVAAEILRNLQGRYPKLDAELVFSTEKGQASVESAVREPAKEFPEMIRGGPNKNQHLKALPKGLEPTLSTLEAELEFDPEVQIEIRFKNHNLHYEEVIWPLQKDPLIDRKRTPQSKASIRIVVGTVGDLCSR